MKESIIKFKDTGPVEVNTDIVCMKFKKRRLRKGTNKICSETFISRWHDEYKLCDVSNSKLYFKVAISRDDAAIIIDKLNLFEEKSGTFRHASTFRISA